MKKRWVRLIGLGVVVYLLALVVQFPASWALHWARGSVPDTVAWEGVEGTVWSPRFQRVAVSLPNGGRLLIGPGEVRMQPGKLLTGELGYTFRAELLGGQVRGRLNHGFGDRWEIPEIQGRLDLANLGEVDPRLAMAEARGGLLFAGQELHGGSLPEGGQVRATLEDLRVGLVPTAGPLGEYALEGEVSGPGRLEGTVETLNGGTLDISGRYRVDLQARTYRFNGEGQAGAEAPEVLRDMLPMLGTVRDGRVTIRQQGRLP
ncbi:hypothetical protein AN478_08210 [Thiohalorhabdus denitrificans]|uniref:Type II secretion system protein N n=1 Tax=Thiohalorhabdus denitrificans TaxID=381306 RepID=A0A0P9CAV8_9GAMM|nr:type II secretion system protein N [Thiohalorhabdus denitrificans]KPV40119.1 hypothetical protein AN478_08210 [Thiohalorhabdus denitrificans]SCY16563.1 Type II secretion system (T2SS), protein N [Thiohalorhabdus denitrificans]